MLYISHANSVLALLLFFTVNAAWAHDDDRLSCHESFANRRGEVEFISSGRDADVMDIYVKEVENFYKDGGLAQKLHLVRPDQQFIFAPSKELAMLATLGRHPIGTWLDGAKLIYAFQAAGVMEFATPGCPTCRSFYSDATSPREQISILHHVFGHNFFAKLAYVTVLRNYDPVAESARLSDYVNELEYHHDKTEVHQWYQYLSSLPMLQDMPFGSFQDPKEFAPEKAYNSDGIRVAHPKTPTVSVIQAIVANLPPTAPEWKVKMAQMFEKMNRNVGDVPSRKIMNEGFATILQEILWVHAGHTSHEDLVDHAMLLTGVAGRGNVMFNNPYWLGREAWRAVRRRFNERDDIRHLDPLSRDAAFIDHAAELIKVMSDLDFLKFALDEKFVHKFKLFLGKEVDQDKLDPMLPGFDPQKHNTQFEVLTRDADILIKNIIDRFGDMRAKVPQIMLNSLGADGGQMVQLSQMPFKHYPIEKFSAAKTMFVLSQVLEKSISLDAEFVFPPDASAAEGAHNPYARVSRPPPQITKAKMIVRPNGGAEIYVGEELKKDEGLSHALTETINQYRDSNIGMSSAMLTAVDEERFKPIISAIVDHNLNQVMGLVGHAKNSAKALEEYSKIVRSRLAKALKLLKEGKLKFRSTKRGIAIGVLPEIPNFDFDHKGVSLAEEINSGSRFFVNTIEGVLRADTTTAAKVGIGVGEKKKGERWWGTKPQDNQGDGEDDEEDDGEGKKPADGQGGEGGEPFEVEIPFALLNEVLDLELPNQKAKDAEDILNNDRVKDGGTARPNGEILWSRMMGKIVANGKSMKKRQERDKSTNEPQRKARLRDFIREGMKLVSPDDHIVVDHDIVKRPEGKAVLVRIMDQSGSMHGRPQELIKIFYKNMIEMLKKKYESLEVINIGFNHAVAMEMTEKQFFGSFLNGADRYILGYQKAIEVLKREKYSNYDRYSLIAGDFQSEGGPEVDQALAQYYSLLNWGGAIQTTLYGDVGSEPLIGSTKNFAAKNQWFDFSTLEDSPQSQIQILLNFFGKNKPPKGQ